MNNKTYLETLVSRHNDNKFIQMHHYAETGVIPSIAKIEKIRSVIVERNDRLKNKSTKYLATCEDAMFRKRATAANEQFMEAYNKYMEKRNVA